MSIPDARFDEYVQLVVQHGAVRGRHSVATLVAIGAAESGLDNLAVGNNARNGSSDSPAFYDLGLGWLQHDTYWLEQDRIVNGVEYDWRRIRSDPAYSLDLLVARPGMIVYQGQDCTYVRWQSWMVYPKKSDPFMRQAVAAYDRL